MKTSTIVNHLMRVIKYKYQKTFTPNDVNEIVDRHFSSWVSENHINKRLFIVLINELGGKPAKILETGTSAWGTDSTRFWDTYISKFGGEVFSVDIRPEAGVLLRHQLSRRTKLITSDSVAYLKNFTHEDVNLIYFDSADVDWQDPSFSIQHGQNELLAVISSLRPGQIIVFDDTPKNESYVDESLSGYLIQFERENGYYPGKGSLAIQRLLEKFEIEVLHHEYAFAAKIIR